MNIIQESEITQIKTTVYARHGVYEKGDKTVYWSVLFNGDEEAINVFRTSNIDEYMKNSSPHIDFQRCIDESVIQNKLHIGSSLIYAKITFMIDHIEVIVSNIGDSRAVIFANDIHFFISEPHTFNNGKEITRLIKESRINKIFPTVEKGIQYKIIAPNLLCGTKETYMNFIAPNNIRLHKTTTQSIGNMGVCGISPEVNLFRFNLKDKINIFLINNGVLFDDIDFFKNVAFAKDVIIESEKKWKQTWNYYTDSDFIMPYEMKIPKENCKDSGCCIIRVV